MDAHIHLPTFPITSTVEALRQTLAFGVTTSHDPSNNTETVFTNAEMIRAGLKLGPRLFSTGTILYGAETPFKAVVESYEDAVAHLKRLQAVGAQYPAAVQAVDPEEVFADPSIDAVAIATPVSTHFPLASAALSPQMLSALQEQAPLALASGWFKAWRVANKRQATVLHAHWVIPGGVIAAYVAQMRPDLVRGIFLEDPPLFRALDGTRELPTQILEASSRIGTYESEVWCTRKDGSALLAFWRRAVAVPAPAQAPPSPSDCAPARPRPCRCPRRPGSRPPPPPS